MSLILLATAKQYLQISHAEEDDVLQIMLDGAESWVADQAGICLCSDDTAQITETLDGGNLFLWPKYCPINSIVQIVDKGDGDKVVSASEYSFKPTYIYRWDDDAADVSQQPWDEGFQRYQVMYTAGYDADTMPAAIKRAVLHYVYQDYHGRDEKKAGLWTPERDKELRGMILAASPKGILQ